MAMIAIAGNHAVLARLERRLQTHGDSLLPDVQVAKPADQAKAIKLTGFFLKPADQQHLPIEFEQLFIARSKALVGCVRLLQAAQGKFIWGGSSRVGGRVPGSFLVSQCVSPGEGYTIAIGSSVRKRNCAFATNS